MIAFVSFPWNYFPREDYCFSIFWRVGLAREAVPNFIIIILINATDVVPTSDQKRFPSAAVNKLKSRGNTNELVDFKCERRPVRFKILLLVTLAARTSLSAWRKPVYEEAFKARIKKESANTNRVEDTSSICDGWNSMFFRPFLDDIWTLIAFQFPKEIKRYSVFAISVKKNLTLNVEIVSVISSKKIFDTPISRVQLLLS